MSKESDKNIHARPPVVVVLGHVDHGKTTLLDYLRTTKVAEREAGGITQSVGAYEIIKNDNKITFIDTPGHEAFTKMRERGAKIADVAILVVAADDGVKPQTEEVIKILQKNEIPFIVAINKLDKNNADIEKTKQDLLNHGVMLEGFGGDIPFASISAKTGEGVDDMLDLVVLLSEMSGLKWDESANASGFILESEVEKQRGTVVSLIVKNGVLKKGDKIYTKSSDGSVKLLENFMGEKVDEIKPSGPAMVIGFNQLPDIGDTFSTSKEDLENPESVEVDKDENSEEKESLDGKKEINVVLRGDTNGSVEALSSVISNLVFEDFYINITMADVGDITDGVIKNALATKAFVVGFNVKVDKNAQNIAKSYDIKIISSDIIYRIVEAIEDSIKNIEKEEETGKLKILATFSSQGENYVVGGEVVSGFLQLNDRVNIIRDDEIISKGRIINLQQAKKDIKRAEEGECGLRIKSPEEIKEGDIVEVILE